MEKYFPVNIWFSIYPTVGPEKKKKKRGWKVAISVTLCPSLRGRRLTGRYMSCLLLQISDLVIIFDSTSGVLSGIPVTGQTVCYSLSLPCSNPRLKIHLTIVHNTFQNFCLSWKNDGKLQTQNNTKSTSKTVDFSLPR